MKLRSVEMILLAALALFPALASAQAARAKPNIILKVSDHFGYGEAGVYWWRP